MQKTANRDIALDIIKGIAILLMVIGHTRVNKVVVDFIYLFHMPVFFIMAGYLFNANKVKTLKGLINFSYRRFTRLLLTAILWNCIFLICQNFLLDIHFYTDDSTVSEAVVHRIDWGVGSGGGGAFIWAITGILDTQLGGAMWFLKALFWSSVIYATILYVCQVLRIKPMLVLSAVACSFIIKLCFHCKLGMLDKILWLIRGNETLNGFLMFHIGVLLKLCKDNFEMNRAVHFFHERNFLTFCLMGIFLLGSLPITQSVRQSYANSFYIVILYVCNGMAGWFLLMAMARLALSLVKGSYMVLCLQYLGQHTMPIVIFHFLAFKFVNAFGVMCLNFPSYYISAFPSAYPGLLWSMVYTAFAIAFCLSLDYIWGFATRRLSTDVMYS